MVHTNGRRRSRDGSHFPFSPLVKGPELSLINATSVTTPAYSATEFSVPKKKNEQKPISANFVNRIPATDSGIPDYDATGDPHCTYIKSNAFKQSPYAIEEQWGVPDLYVGGGSSSKPVRKRPRPKNTLEVESLETMELALNGGTAKRRSSTVYELAAYSAIFERENILKKLEEHIRRFCQWFNEKNGNSSQLSGKAVWHGMEAKLYVTLDSLRKATVHTVQSIMIWREQVGNRLIEHKDGVHVEFVWRGNVNYLLKILDDLHFIEEMGRESINTNAIDFLKEKLRVPIHRNPLITPFPIDKLVENMELRDFETMEAFSKTFGYEWSSLFHILQVLRREEDVANGNSNISKTQRVRISIDSKNTSPDEMASKTTRRRTETIGNIKDVNGDQDAISGQRFLVTEEDITSLRDSIRCPSDLVCAVVGAIKVLLLGLDEPIPDSSSLSWQNLRSEFLCDPTFLLDRLALFDPKVHITTEKAYHLQMLFTDDRFTPEDIQTTSIAAARLCSWALLKAGRHVLRPETCFDFQDPGLPSDSAPSYFSPEVMQSAKDRLHGHGHHRRRTTHGRLSRKSARKQGSVGFGTRSGMEEIKKIREELDELKRQVILGMSARRRSSVESLSSLPTSLTLDDVLWQGTVSQAHEVLATQAVSPLHPPRDNVVYEVKLYRASPHPVGELCKPSGISVCSEDVICAVVEPGQQSPKLILGTAPFPSRQATVPSIDALVGFEDPKPYFQTIAHGMLCSETAEFETCQLDPAYEAFALQGESLKLWSKGMQLATFDCEWVDRVPAQCTLVPGYVVEMTRTYAPRGVQVLVTHPPTMFSSGVDLDDSQVRLLCTPSEAHSVEESNHVASGLVDASVTPEMCDMLASRLFIDVSGGTSRRVGVCRMVHSFRPRDGLEVGMLVVPQERMSAATSPHGDLLPAAGLVVACLEGGSADPYRFGQVVKKALAQDETSDEQEKEAKGRSEEGAENAPQLSALLTAMEAQILRTPLSHKRFGWEGLVSRLDFPTFGGFRLNRAMYVAEKITKTGKRVSIAAEVRNSSVMFRSFTLDNFSGAQEGDESNLQPLGEEEVSTNSQSETAHVGGTEPTQGMKIRNMRKSTLLVSQQDLRSILRSETTKRLSMSLGRRQSGIEELGGTSSATTAQEQENPKLLVNEEKETHPTAGAGSFPGQAVSLTEILKPEQFELLCELLAAQLNLDEVKGDLLPFKDAGKTQQKMPSSSAPSRVALTVCAADSANSVSDSSQDIAVIKLSSSSSLAVVRATIEDQLDKNDLPHNGSFKILIKTGIPCSLKQESSVLLEDTQFLPNLYLVPTKASKSTENDSKTLSMGKGKKKQKRNSEIGDSKSSRKPGKGEKRKSMRRNSGIATSEARADEKLDDDNNVNAALEKLFEAGIAEEAEEPVEEEHRKTTVIHRFLLPGTVLYEPESDFLTSSIDYRLFISRGDNVQLDGEVHKVSEDPKKEFSGEKIPLDAQLKGPMSNTKGVSMYKAVSEEVKLVDLEDIAVSVTKETRVVKTLTDVRSHVNRGDLVRFSCQPERDYYISSKESDPYTAEEFCLSLPFTGDTNENTTLRHTEALEDAAYIPRLKNLVFTEEQLEEEHSKFESFFGISMSFADVRDKLGLDSYPKVEDYWSVISQDFAVKKTFQHVCQTWFPTSTDGLDGAKFTKLAKELPGVVSKQVKLNALDLIFAKCKNKGDRRVSYKQFRDKLIPALAVLKYPNLEPSMAKEHFVKTHIQQWKECELLLWEEARRLALVQEIKRQCASILIQKHFRRVPAQVDYNAKKQAVRKIQHNFRSYLIKRVTRENRAKEREAYERKMQQTRLKRQAKQKAKLFSEARKVQGTLLIISVFRRAEGAVSVIVYNPKTSKTTTITVTKSDLARVLEITTGQSEWTATDMDEVQDEAEEAIANVPAPRPTMYSKANMSALVGQVVLRVRNNSHVYAVSKVAAVVNRGELELRRGVFIPVTDGTKELNIITINSQGLLGYLFSVYNPVTSKTHQVKLPEEQLKQWFRYKPTESSLPYMLRPENRKELLEWFLQRLFICKACAISTHRKRHRNGEQVVMLEFEVVIQREHTMAMRIQGMWRSRKALQFLRQELRKRIELRFDLTYNSYYYYNKVTGEINWEKPKLLGSEELELPEDEWREVFDQNGNVYYFHPLTGRTSWLSESQAATIVQKLYRHKKAMEFKVTDLVMMAKSVRLHEKAKENYEQAPSRLSSLVNYALHLFTFKGDIEKAQPLMEKAFKLAPQNPLVMFCTAIYQLALNAYPKKTTFENAMNLANLARQMDPELSKFEVAKVSFFHWSLVCHPKSSFANLNWALVCQAVLKDYDSAERFYRRAVELDPTNESAIANLQEFSENRFPGGRFAGGGPGTIVLKRSQVKRSVGEWQLMQDPTIEEESEQSLKHSLFWFNSKTGKTQWQEPDWAAVNIERVSRSTVLDTDPTGSWKLMQDPYDDSEFFYCFHTGEVSTERPVVWILD